MRSRAGRGLRAFIVLLGVVVGLLSSLPLAWSGQNRTPGACGAASDRLDPPEIIDPQAATEVPADSGADPAKTPLEEGSDSSS